MDTDESDTIIGGNVRVRNCGSGPAVITELVARIALVANRFSCDGYSECEEMPVSHNIRSIGEEISDFVRASGMFVKATPPSPPSTDRELVFYGRYRYRDVFGTTYETGFFYYVESLLNEEEWVTTYPARNYST